MEHTDLEIGASGGADFISAQFLLFDLNEPLKAEHKSAEQ